MTVMDQLVSHRWSDSDDHDDDNDDEYDDYPDHDDKYGDIRCGHQGRSCHNHIFADLVLMKINHSMIVEKKGGCLIGFSNLQPLILTC